MNKLLLAINNWQLALKIGMKTKINERKTYEHQRKKKTKKKGIKHVHCSLREITRV